LYSCDVRDSSRENAFVDEGALSQFLVPSRLVDYSTAKRIGFVSTCPNGHLASQEYERLRLEELLSIGDVGLYCARCDMGWKATDEERSNLKKLLEQ
jgi:hypothetical protein